MADAEAVAEAPPLPPEFDPRVIEAAFAQEREGRKRHAEVAEQLHRQAKEALDSGRWTQMAIELLERAITLCPGVAVFHHDLGAAYYQVGDVASAVKALDKALQLAPEQEE
jgi:Flp pilus assembly protein TadD